MARFDTAPLDQVVTKRKRDNPSMRAQIAKEYREALESALDDGQALVVELEEDDKPLTIRNRIKRAADYLGYEHITIRRRKNRVLAYMPAMDEQGEKAVEAEHEAVGAGTGNW